MKKEDEYVLSHKVQPKEVLNLFTIIYIILNENYFKIPTQNLILNLVNILLKKYQVDSISILLYITFRIVIIKCFTSKNKFIK